MLTSVMLWHLLSLNIYYNPWLSVPYKPTFIRDKKFWNTIFIAGWNCINDDQSVKMEERKQRCLFISQQIQRRRLKKVCNTKVLPDMNRKLSSSQNQRNFTHHSFSSPYDKLYHHRHKFIDNQQLLLSIMNVSPIYN